MFFLRIEDTDQKRQIENGVTEIISALDEFQIRFDEGAVGETEDSGRYGPYRQSRRRELYQAFAKHLVEIGRAYPCFCTAGELEAVRQRQEEADAPQKGYYGQWAPCRDLDEETVMMDALDCGAADVEADGDVFEITTEPDDFNAVTAALEAKGYAFAEAAIEMVPQNYIKLTDEEEIKNMSKMIDLLEDNDDVQNVWHNWEQD